MANISFLPVTGKISIAGVKEILLNTNFQNTVIGVYNNNSEVVNYKNSNSIKDVISNTFSTSTPSVGDSPVSPEAPATGVPEVTQPEPAVILSAIPAGMDDLSKEPVNMSFDAPSIEPQSVNLTPEPSAIPNSTPEVTPAVDSLVTPLPDTGITITPLAEASLDPITPATPAASLPTNEVPQQPATEELKSFGGDASGVNIFDMDPNSLGISESEINNPNLSVEPPSTSPFDIAAPTTVSSTPESTPIASAVDNLQNVETTITALNEASKDNSELKALLSEYTQELLKSAENKIKGAEIEKNIATIVNKIANTLEKTQNEELIDSNSGANLFNNNSLDEKALDQIPTEIIPFQVPEQERTMGLAA